MGDAHRAVQGVEHPGEQPAVDPLDRPVGDELPGRVQQLLGGEEAEQERQAGQGPVGRRPVPALPHRVGNVAHQRAGGEGGGRRDDRAGHDRRHQAGEEKPSGPGKQPQHLRALPHQLAHRDRVVVAVASPPPHVGIVPRQRSRRLRAGRETVTGEADRRLQRGALRFHPDRPESSPRSRGGTMRVMSSDRPADFTTYDGLPISQEQPHGVAIVVVSQSPDGWRYLILHRAHRGRGCGRRLGLDSTCRSPLSRRGAERVRGSGARGGDRPARGSCAASDRRRRLGCLRARRRVEVEIIVDGVENDRFEWVPLEEALVRCHARRRFDAATTRSSVRPRSGAVRSGHPRRPPASPATRGSLDGLEDPV